MNRCTVEPLHRFKTKTPKTINLAQKYIKDVQEGNILVGRYVQLAVQRHLNMLTHAKEKGIYFDEQAAGKALGFISMLRHTKGEHAGVHFKVAGWQAFIIWVIFGWKQQKNGYRLIQKVYVEIAKKNGKTELAAAIAIYMFLMDGEFGSEVYIGATKKEQSGICFRAITGMIQFLRRDSELVRHTVAEPQRWNIHSLKTGSKIEPLGKDSKTDQGINTHCGIIDEYWAHPDSEVLDNIETSMVARTQPLLFIITTAGFDIESECYKLRKTSAEILEGIKEDDSFFCMVFCFDEGDDWEDEVNWIKPIPNMDVSVRLDNIRKQYVKAKNEGTAKLRAFKTLNLNMWHASNFESWLPDEVWQSCSATYSPDEMKGRMAFGGLDMAATSDIASIAYFFPATDTGKHRLLMKYYLPGEGIEEKAQSDGASYTDWARDGWFTLIDSNVILSHSGRTRMRDDIMQAFQDYNIQLFGFDRWNAFGLVSDLTDEGLNPDILAPFGMGYKSLSNPTTYFTSWVQQQEIEHLPDPVLRWMVSNVIIETDGENIKPSRKRSTGKIDGVMAAIIAIGQYFIWNAERQTGRSIYENVELWED